MPSIIFILGGAMLSNDIAISDFIKVLPFVLATFFLFMIRTLRRTLEILEQLFSN